MRRPEARWKGNSCKQLSCAHNSLVGAIPQSAPCQGKCRRLHFACAAAVMSWHHGCQKVAYAFNVKHVTLGLTICTMICTAPIAALASPQLEAISSTWPDDSSSNALQDDDITVPGQLLMRKVSTPTAKCVDGSPFQFYYRNCSANWDRKPGGVFCTV